MGTPRPSQKVETPFKLNKAAQGKMVIVVVAVVALVLAVNFFKVRGRDEDKTKNIANQASKDDLAGGSGADTNKGAADAKTKLGKGVQADSLTRDSEREYSASLGSWKAQLQAEEEAKRKAAERARVAAGGAPGQTQLQARTGAPGVNLPPSIGPDGTANPPGQQTYWNGSPMFDARGKKLPPPPPPAPGSPEAKLYAQQMAQQRQHGMPGTPPVPGQDGQQAMMPSQVPMATVYPGSYIITKEGRLQPAWLSGSYVPPSSEESQKMDALYFRGRMNPNTTIDPSTSKASETLRKQMTAVKNGVPNRPAHSGLQGGSSPVVRNDRMVSPSNEWGGWVNVEEKSRTK
jgi:hypothetical protein